MNRLQKMARFNLIALGVIGCRGCSYRSDSAKGWSRRYHQTSNTGYYADVAAGDLDIHGFQRVLGEKTATRPNRIRRT